MAVVLLTGFASGLPAALTADTLQAWMTQRGVDLGRIGLFAAVALPYSLKFLWSPLMDRFVPPFLGRRRGWMLLTQTALAGGIAAMALLGGGGLWVLAATALAVAFFSASQDIVVDAYRTDLLAPHELGAGAGLAIAGYRVGFVCSGALAMNLADHMPWAWVYLLMAGAMLASVAVTLAAPEPAVNVRPPATLREAVVQPLAEFLRRRGAGEMLLFILIYKLDWGMVQSMMTPFLVQTGFSLSVIGNVKQGLGMAAAIAGASVGGAVIVRLGVRRALWIFGLAQGLAGLSFTALALVGLNYAMMTAAVITENVCTGMATAAFAGFLMSLCDKRFTATQYALLTGVMTLGTKQLAGVPSGWLAVQIGWAGYFLVATLIAAPSLLLLRRYRTWEGAVQDEPAWPP